jgi:hypothetical protein
MRTVLPTKPPSPRVQPAITTRLLGGSTKQTAWDDPKLRRNHDLRRQRRQEISVEQAETRFVFRKSFPKAMNELRRYLAYRSRINSTDWQMPDTIEKEIFPWGELQLGVLSIWPKMAALSSST